MLVLLLLQLCSLATARVAASPKPFPMCKLRVIPGNTVGHYRCREDGSTMCLPGWTGDLCQVPICKKGCDPMNGYCKKPFECLCKIGWHGELCNKCTKLPGCLYGTCSSKSFDCKCEEGWKGLFCNQAICKEGCHPSRGYCDNPGECKCRIGWTGENCDKCKTLPGCINGYCRRPLECTCQKGWLGLFCDKAQCDENCDKIRGYCTKPGECRCKVGWWGKRCDTCFPYPGCKHGHCEKPWECKCKPGWKGMLCDDEDIDYCRSHYDPCFNEGACISVSRQKGYYKCVCPPDFTGKHCDYLIKHEASASFIINPLDPSIRRIINITEETTLPTTTNIDQPDTTTSKNNQFGENRAFVMPIDGRNE